MDGVEIIVAAERSERLVEAMRKAAGTGRIGDGKIFVSHVEQVIRIRIRTGESGTDAL